MDLLILDSRNFGMDMIRECKEVRCGALKSFWCSRYDNVLNDKKVF